MTRESSTSTRQSEYVNALEERIDNLGNKIVFLLQSYNLTGPDGFTFPDGETWLGPIQNEAKESRLPTKPERDKC
jgi:hypothetical protein